MNFFKAFFALPRLFKEELDFLREGDWEPDEEFKKALEEAEKTKDCICVYQCVKCGSMTSDDTDELFRWMTDEH